MKENTIKQIRLSLIALLFIFSTLGWTAIMVTAAGDGIAVRLPYEHIYTTDDESVDDTFYYMLTALSPDTPLPVGSGEDSFKWMLKGTVAEDTLTLKLPVEKPGVYSYHLKALVPEEKPGYTYEKREYDISVSIIRSGNELVLNNIVILKNTDNDDPKMDKIELDPSYKHQGTDDPGEDKPGEDKPGDDKPGDDKPSDDKKEDDKPGDVKPVEDGKDDNNKDDTNKGNVKDDSGSTGGKGSYSGPKTGDQTPVEMFLVTLMLSGMFIFLMIFWKKKNENKQVDPRDGYGN